jgi:VWFA-related protein
MAREAATQLLEQLRADEEAYLVTLSTCAELRQDFMSNTREIADALVFTNPDGSTSLVDGVNLGLEHMKKAHTPRRALVVVSAGGDDNSRYKRSELLARAVEADTLINTMCMFQDPQTPELGGAGLLANLAKQTGGITFLVKNQEEMTSLGHVMGSIDVTMHNQYVLGYYPPENGQISEDQGELFLPTGMPEIRIYARTGYYAP